MAAKAAPIPPLHPDRLTIWPADEGRFGADVLYLGRGGYQRAVAGERDLRAAGIGATLRQDVDGAWGLRIGPLERRALRAIFDEVTAPSAGENSPAGAEPPASVRPPLRPARVS